MNTQPTPISDRIVSQFRKGESSSDGLILTMVDLEIKLAAVTAQRDKYKMERDEAREYADKLAEGLPEGMLPKDVEVLREVNLNLATELTAVTEQRDRLAKALNMYAWPCSNEELSHYCCSASPSFSVEAQREMKRRNALQSLTQPKKYDANEHQSFYP